jgi:multiple sugar transport system permease protein
MTAISTRDSRRPPPPARLAPRRRRGRGGWVSLLPFLAFVVLFGAYPFFQVIRMALSSVTLTNGQFVWAWSGLGNLTAQLSDSETWRVLLNTVVFTAGATIGSLIVGIVVALLVQRAVLLLPLARNVLIWPAIIAPVVVSLMWLLILSPTAGGLNKVLSSLGQPAQQWLNTGFGAMTSVIVLDIWHWSPVVFLFVYTALQTMDTAVLEAARIDGAGPMQILRFVTLPLIAPAIGAVALVRIVMSVKAFDEMYLLTAGGPNGATTLVTQRIKDLFFDRLDFGGASAFGLLVVLLTTVVIGIAVGLRSRAKGRP